MNKKEKQIIIDLIQQYGTDILDLCIQISLFICNDKKFKKVIIYIKRLSYKNIDNCKKQIII